jgi:hypothetical protein
LAFHLNIAKESVRIIRSYSSVGGQEMVLSELAGRKSSRTPLSVPGHPISDAQSISLAFMIITGKAGDDDQILICPK